VAPQPISEKIKTELPVISQVVTEKGRYGYGERERGG
jgi:hypothetical protein